MELLARHYATGRPVRVTLAAGRIASVQELPPDARRDEQLATLAPGLVDLQINGYAGHDLNAHPLARGTLPAMTRALAAQGVTAFLPTLITSGDEALTHALRTMAADCDADPETAAAVPGVHLEGPFISPDDGPRGAHPREHVRPPDLAVFRKWQAASGDRVRLLTMSPEHPASPDFIAAVVAAGVTVSIGHTAATPDQIAAAVRAGASCSTHLGNAAHPVLPRHPNYLWEQLAQDDLHATLIADGFHLPDQFLKVAMRVKGDRAMLVSDAVSLAGLPPGEYASPVGGRVVLTAAGRLHLAHDSRLLAGSAQVLLDGVAHLTGAGLAAFPQAWDMASMRPARFMKLATAAGLSAGAPADLVLLDPDASPARPRVRATYKSGRPTFAA